ncbi:unnamed protein product, partial [Chrysoparadoxa australica]
NLKCFVRYAREAGSVSHVPVPSLACYADCYFEKEVEEDEQALKSSSGNSHQELQQLLLSSQLGVEEMVSEAEQQSQKLAQAEDTQVLKVGQEPHSAVTAASGAVGLTGSSTRPPLVLELHPQHWKVRLAAVEQDGKAPALQYCHAAQSILHALDSGRLPSQLLWTLPHVRCVDG